MNVKVTNEAEICDGVWSKLDLTADTGDSDNPQWSLLDLQNSNVVGGSKTFNDAATLVSVWVTKRQR